MDRRTFVCLAASGFMLSGCLGPAEVICDPDLEHSVDRALQARTGGDGAYELEALAPRELLARAETQRGLIVVTREEKIADRLQRLSYVRLRHRWKPLVHGEPVQILVTKGSGEGSAVRLAKWLATGGAERHLNAL
jgi:hypothetical protein